MALLWNIGFENTALFLIRIVLALIFIRGGFRKTKNPKNVAKMAGWPVGLGRTLGIFELIAGIAILLGLYTQIAILVPIVVMLGALYYKFFKWKKSDVEFDLLILVSAIVILVLGAGAASIDKLLGLI